MEPRDAARAGTREAGNQPAADAARGPAGTHGGAEIYRGIRRAQRAHRLAAARDPVGAGPRIAGFGRRQRAGAQAGSLGAGAGVGADGFGTRDAGDSRAGADQPAGAGAPRAGRHHPHRAAAAGHAAGRRRSPVPRPVRRFRGPQFSQNSSRRSCMSIPDLKAANVARAQFTDLGPNGGGATGQEMNLNLILDVAVTLALEVGRARMSVRDLLQLAPGAIVELDRLAGEPLDVLVNGVALGRGEG